MIPVVSVIGPDKEGKTSAVVDIVKELTKRGYRVGTIKHHLHDDFEIDIPGKASFRHRAAGAAEVAVASPTMLAFIKSNTEDPRLSDLTSMFSSNINIVITEGYAAADTYKVDTPVADVKEIVDDIEMRFLAVNKGR
jgi:molybdopterin-guanine dinucleotide biosynthesis adapter protein